MARSDNDENNCIQKKLSKLTEKSHIPDYIFEEFNLPQDMRNRDVDFKMVSIIDSMQAIKRPVWSG